MQCIPMCEGRNRPGKHPGKHPGKRPSHYAVWAGARIQGKATFHLWDPEKKLWRAFRMKIERDWNFNGKKGRINHWASARSSVQNSDTVEEVMRAAPLAEGEFYKETFAATVKGLPITYSFLIRRIPEDAMMRGRRLAFLPFHGLYGSVHKGEFAARSHLTVEDWFRKEFIRLFSRFIAEVALKRGIWVEGHTQNGSGMFDRKNGKAVKVYIKDLADVMISPFIQSVEGILPDDQSSGRELPTALLNERWIDSNASTADKYAGHFVGLCRPDSGGHDEPSADSA